MNFKKYENTQKLLFVSGMFAGGWIWDNAHKQIQRSQHLLLEEPLCKIGGKVNTISQRITEELESIEGKVTMIGNSLGSYICMDVAQRVPEKVESVIISGSAGFGEVKLDVKLNHKEPLSAAKSLIDLIFFDKSKISSEAQMMTAKSFEDNFRNILKLMRESNLASASELLSKIKCPVYAIWGENDEITPLAQASEAFEEYNIPVKLIKECGHSPMYEKPAEFAQHVNALL